MSLAGRSVVVTGAGSGIGRAIAVQLAAQGALVTVVGRRETALKETVAQLDAEVEIVAADLCTPDSADRIIDAAIDRFGRVDGLVNNAGLARFGRIDEVDVADLDALLAVNVRGPAQLIKAALPHLRSVRGSIVNVTSVAGALSMPGRSYYGASKAAMNSLTRSLARELAPDVRVNAVLPGPVDTPMWQDLGLSPMQTELLRRDMVAGTPMGRFGEEDEIARWVACLLDPDFAGWITGVLLPVDGGRTT
ncbi:glucose 1-dehydrogenase [Kribbella sandramycini]|uniref:NAD(P)-dependent dehydrogenase (Short-subunit alcohol dehydrogenase family) n=1 Tax=Kribbella sandramycini TaxID=60450 RepID=A0A841SEJ6_9ACTN|nr:NAD(P)-dependent dehydrogenase (short-subunit alcohol dehydrogenase family) [Kribbella sandramycini]